MMITLPLDELHDAEALTYRLTQGIVDSPKEVVFVVGSPLTQNNEEQDGVLGVNGVISLISDVFEGSQAFDTLKHRLKTASNPYQSAFHFLSGRKGPTEVQNVIQRAVLNAHASYDSSSDDFRQISPSLEALDSLNNEQSGWSLRPGVASIGRLAASAPNHFGGSVITSNFDPLLQVSMKRAGIGCWTTRLHGDGDPALSTADGVQIIHIHGFWSGTDCLHTGVQLTQSRPHLQNWLIRQLRGKIVVVMAYGGWDDIFMRALNSVLSDAGEYPEVLWTFYDEVPSVPDRVEAILAKGRSRARLSMYSGVNCHDVLPEIAKFWEEVASDKLSNSGEDGAVSTSEVAKMSEGKPNRPPASLPSQHADRPPSILHWVGRENELSQLLKSYQPVVSINGFGGEGKSFIAARYLEEVKSGNTPYTHADWRDCKEQSDTLRTKLMRLIERLTNGKLVSDDLGHLPNDGLVALVIESMESAEAVVVLDNVDEYVDFDENRCIGILDLLIKACSANLRNSRLIFTCRPNVEYGLIGFTSFRMEGLSPEATYDLYKARVPSHELPEAKISRIHAATDGHAFWNDLLASQLAHHRGLSLDDVLKRVETGDVDTPDILMFLWKEMPDREHQLLRVMAEIVRPESVETLNSMVGSRLGFAKVSKALRSLQTQNLIVRKVETNEADLYDLHPLVRTFVRSTSVGAERTGIIRIILSQYAVIISGIGEVLGVHLPPRLMERYSERAELEIELGDFTAAFKTLDECVSVLIGSGNGEQFVRVARKLFISLNWETASRDNPSFLNLAGHYVEAMAYLGDHKATEEFLCQLETVVPPNTADYIRLCNFRTVTHWIMKEYDDAIDWGKKGVQLKNKSGLDTDADCEHSLALSLRDGGNPDEAIEMFLKKHKLEELLDYEDRSVAGNGPMLGNVGRCLQLKNDHEGALICFHRSFSDIENANGATRATNRSWLREWVGRSLEAQEKLELASIFYQAARAQLGTAWPVRISILNELIKAIGIKEEPNNATLERKVKAWMTQERMPS